MASGVANRKYIAILAISSAVILTVGTLMRPQPLQTEPATTRSPGEIVRLEQLTQRRSVEDYAEYFAHVAGLVEQSVLLLASSGQTGVIWDSRAVLTAARRGPFPVADKTALRGGELELTTAIAGPHLPYVLLSTAVDVIPRERVPSRFYSPGSWLVAVWRTPDGSMRYSEGHLLGGAAGDCNGLEVTEVITNFSREYLNPGAGLFDLDGNLVAVALTCDTETIAIDADALAVTIVPDDSLEARLTKRYGMRVDTATKAELAHFERNAGAMVREVWTGYGAHQAGLLPGDFILSIDGQDVEAVADLERLTLPVSTEMLELVVWRARRRLKLSLPARFMAAAMSSPHGFVGSEQGLPILRTDQGSLAERAGARAGDRLVAVNQAQPQSFADVDRAFARSNAGTVHLIFERYGRLWGAFAEKP